MRQLVTIGALVVFGLGLAAAVAADEPKRDQAIYVDDSKDSNRSSRHGKFEGYYFYRDDYVRLKMLTFMVRKDDIADILARVDGDR
jgi:hypothetical protein